MKSIIVLLLSFTFSMIQAAESLQDSSYVSQQYFQFFVGESPENALFIGYPSTETLWTDYSPEGIERKVAKLNEFITALEHIEPMQPQEQLECDLIQWVVKDALREIVLGQQYLQLNQLNGIHLVIGDTLANSPMSAPDEVKACLDRLAALPQLIDQVIALAREGMNKNIVPAKISVVGIPSQIRQLMPQDPRESYYFSSFINQKDSSVEEKALRIMQERVYPALERLHDFIAHEYISSCRDEIGWSALPDGKAWYEHCVKTHTTTSLTPGEIHMLGLSEVARIRKAMRAIIAEVEFEGTEEEFFDYLRTDPSFFLSEREDVLQGYRDLLAAIETQLPVLFGVLPKLPCDVVAVPAYSEQAAPAAYYMPGSITGRKGQFFTNTYDLKSNPKWEMDALALHEALPGHHLQITIVLENDDLSHFRKTVFFTSYCEGWALYAEGLGKELGLYKDPYTRFGRLVFESLRAVRLVVDTGIHAFGWTRQEAIDYMLENTTLTLHSATAEIDRYITWPGQALAYKIGELKILELRHRAEEVLGDQFDIRAFHDFILLPGMLPLSILEEQFEEWLEAQVTFEAIAA